MKHIFVFSLLFVTIFLSTSFANEELKGSRGLAEDVEEKSSQLEARMERFLKIAKQGERLRAVELDGREVVVRIYNNWQEAPAEFEEVYVQLDGSTISLDSSPDIDESAFVVVVKEDQDDEVVIRSLGDYIYAEPYREELRFKLPHSGSFRYDLTFKDALGNPLSQASVQIFLYAEEFGKDSRILVREIELDESGFFKGPSIDGSLNRFYLVISHPDNYGTVTVDPAALGFYEKFVISRLDTIRVPWVPKGSNAYERSIRGVVVDDANNPIINAMIKCNFIYPRGEERPESLHDGISEVLTDEQGRFCLYRSIKKYNSEPGKFIPPKSKYYVLIEAPKELGIMPFRGCIVNDVEHTIKMAEYGYFHTFVFEDEDGPITDPNRLKEISLVVQAVGKPVIIYRYDDFKDGGYFPPGRYRAMTSGAHEKFGFEPIEVNEVSFEELVFKVRFLEEVVYTGQVVDGTSGEPMEGAFVIAMDRIHSATYNFAMITPQWWDQLHKIEVHFPEDKNVLKKLRRFTDFPFADLSKELTIKSADIEFSPKDLALWPIFKMYTFEKGVRTGPDGRFEMSFKHRGNFHSFIAFEKDHLAVKVSQAYLTASKNGSFKVPPIPLYPAAKVALEVLIDEEIRGKQIHVGAHLRIDTNDFPEWVGRPYAMIQKQRLQREKQRYRELTKDETRKQYNFGAELNPVMILLSMLYHVFIKDTFYFYGIPIKVPRHYGEAQAEEVGELDPNNGAGWLGEPFEEPKEDPDRVRTFFEIFEDGNYFSFTSTKTIRPNKTQLIYVPAGLDSHLILYIGRGWSPVVVNKTVNLKQGETVDLGSYRMERAMRVFVKVVDSKGEPVEGVPVNRWFSLDDIDWLTTDSTNQNGIVQFNMVPNTRGKFYVSVNKDGQALKKEIAYEMGGKEDNGREFTLEVSDEIFHHLFK